MGADAATTTGETGRADGSELLGLWWAEANTNTITGGDAGVEVVPCASADAHNAEAEEGEIAPIFAQRPSWVFLQKNLRTLGEEDVVADTDAIPDDEGDGTVVFGVETRRSLFLRNRPAFDVETRRLLVLRPNHTAATAVPVVAAARTNADAITERGGGQLYHTS